jgi:hypothetical protein
MRSDVPRRPPSLILFSLDLMRAPLIVGMLALVPLAGAADTWRIDGVPVYGKIHEVPTSEIRQAIDTATDRTKIPPKKPRAIEIVSRTEIRAYWPERALGWIPMRGGLVSNHCLFTMWASGVEDTPEALRLIRSADEVYVFPYPAGAEPRRDDKHLRPLGGEARRQLAALLGQRSHWYSGFYHLAVVPDSGIGLLFRKGPHELVLFFLHGIAKGTINGRSTSGLLEDPMAEQFAKWQKAYAKPELAAK